MSAVFIFPTVIIPKILVKEFIYENRHYWRNGRGTDSHSGDHSKFGEA